ncbi:MAG: hypothetical protein IT502_03360 [Rubrivivax sp.]|nr:hypothetical protein [Rubrivivax sp.]
MNTPHRLFSAVCAALLTLVVLGAIDHLAQVESAPALLAQAASACA